MLLIITYTSESRLMAKIVNVYDYISYKKFLLMWIENAEGRGSLSKMAEAAGCHRTYLSQVLNSKVELTLDHAANLCGFFAFSETESEFFLTSVMYERASQKQAKDFFRKKLEMLLKKNATVSERVPSTVKESNTDQMELGLYYSDPHMAMAHIATSISETQTVGEIAKRLNLSVERTKQILSYLSNLKLVQQNGSRYTHGGANRHLNRKSEFTRMNHLNWRLKASEDSHNDNAIHYTNIFSFSQNDWLELKKNLLNHIERQNDKIHASGSEEIGVFCCDLFVP